MRVADHAGLYVDELRMRLWRKPAIASGFERCSVGYWNDGVLVVEAPTAFDVQCLEHAKLFILETIRELRLPIRKFVIALDADAYWAGK